MTKVPWKGQETSSEVFVAKKAGQCVSVNLMVSMQVGFIAQLKGTLTKKCYTAATVFVDHYSRLKYYVSAQLRFLPVYKWACPTSNF
jgi:hypothetical protein